MSPKAQALVFSLAVHAVFLTLLVVSFADRPSHLPAAPQPAEVVEAVAVDEAQVQAELEKLQQRERARRDAEQARRQRLADEASRMRKAKEAEARRLADLKAQREREVKAQQAEKIRLAKLKAEQEKLAREKAELEQKRAAEQAKLAALEQQRKREEEARRKEEEARRKAEEQRKRAEAEVALKAKLEAEAKRQAQERLRRDQLLMAQYVADIRNKVERNWLRPAGANGGIKCRVLVRQLPGGIVESVQLLQSCGDAALDRSVEAAVSKSSPLPVPPEPELFDREIVFEFKAR